jgi:hypothetical protein
MEMRWETIPLFFKSCAPAQPDAREFWVFFKPTVPPSSPTPPKIHDDMDGHHRMGASGLGGGYGWERAEHVQYAHLEG